jgi:hypothetical protein
MKPQDTPGLSLSLDPQIDWASRADGRMHTLVKGEHFERSARLVQQAARMWAHRRGYRAVTRISADDRMIVVTFVPRAGRV